MAQDTSKAINVIGLRLNYNIIMMKPTVFYLKKMNFPFCH